MKFIMVKTRFYQVVTRNKSIADREVFEEEQRIRQRMAELNIPIPDKRNDSKE